ncbi:MAG: sigma 54-interacting transcriptional regulator [Thermodesulfobacteriota bacterium]
MNFEKLIAVKANLERILDNLKEGIIAHDMNRRIFFFNKEAERITGYDREEVLNRDCHEVFGTPFCGDRCAFLYENPSLLDRNQYSVHINTKEGGTRLIDITVTRMNDENGNFFGVLSSFMDLTDLVDLKLKAGKIGEFSGIIGKDTKMLQVYQQIQNVAGYDYPVHIFGETGTGKELVANAIHQESHRRSGPFVPINCGAIPEGLIESELFGHVKGAFSGAIRDKKGRFELADGGTLFLDEVYELSKSMQVKLLRFLQTGHFEKVGDEKTISVNVRIISATNINLKKALSENRFRDDLYYRLAVIPIHIPPLRERKTDIPLLIEHFLKEASDTYHQKPLRISRDALSSLMDYPWPGNVRELQNTIQFAVVKCNGAEIGIHDLPLEFREFRIIRSSIYPGPEEKNKAGREKKAGKLTRERVESALKEAGGNRSKAARLLGVGRATLYRFLSTLPLGDSFNP